MLALRDVTAPGLLRPVSLELHKGEILGLAGQLGSGANAVVRAVAGVVRPTAARSSCEGAPSAQPLNADAITAWASPIVRMTRSGMGSSRVRTYYEKFYLSRAVAHLRRRAAEPTGARCKIATELAKFFEVDAGLALARHAGKLSGGNHRKLRSASGWASSPRSFSSKSPRAASMWARARRSTGILPKLANQGLAVMFASSDNQEVLGLADTVATFFRGRLVRVASADRLEPEDFSGM